MEKFKNRRWIGYSLSAAGYTIPATLFLFNFFSFIFGQENSKEGMIAFIPAILLGGIPITVVLVFLAGLVQGIADPLVAFHSDRSDSQLGRRRFFLGAGGFALAASAALVFFPPFYFPTGLNLVYLALVLGLFFLFYPVYVTPYLSLLPELGKTEKQRLWLTTAQGCFALFGAAAVIFGGPPLYDLLAQTTDPVTGYRLQAVVFCAAAGPLLYAAFFTVREEKYIAVMKRSQPFFTSVKKTLHDKPFIIYLIANLSLWWAFFVIFFSFEPISRALMGVDEGFAPLTYIVILLGVIICLPLVLFLAGKIGKKPVFIAALALCSLLSLLLAFTGLGANPGGLTCNSVTSIAICECGSVWIGTARGVSVLKDTGWEYYGSGAGLTDISITSALSMPDGSLWLGSENGISIHKMEAWKTLSSGDGLGGNHITALAADKNGTVWSGTASGLSRFDGTSWKTFSSRDGLIADAVTALAVAADGILWCGTAQGLSRYNGSQWRSFTEENGLAYGLVTALAIAPDGTLWCGTTGGLSRYDGVNWTSYKKEDGLIANSVTCLAVAPDGTVWIGTDMGISLYKDSGWSSITQAQGLSSNRITAIHIKDNLDIWVGTRFGVSHLFNYGWEKYINTAPVIWALGVLFLCGFPLAVLLLLPNVFIAELCDHHRTGEHGESMYFGVQGFFMKLGMGLAAVLTTLFFLVWGKDTASPLGVRLACLLACIAAAGGALAFKSYPEKELKIKDGNKIKE